MQSKKDLQLELEVLESMGGIVEAYEEIAAIRMRKVKKSVLQNRDFLSGLNDIYQRVYATYKLFAAKKRYKGAAKDWLPLQTNGREVSILLTSNTGLYGDIVKRTCETFLNNVRNKDLDLVVTGRIGRIYMENNAKSTPYKYFDISDTGVDRESMKDIIDYILKYEKITVFHGIYVSVLSQQPVSTLVTGKAADLHNESTAEAVHCLIEPSVEEVTEFFEKQILASIFEQTVYESSLSKFASRMVSLDIAKSNITSIIARNKFKRLLNKHSDDSRQQSERMSGISIWG